MHQSQSPLVLFGSSTERMRRALDAVRAGQGVCIVDDEDRENEGDLIFPAQFLTVPQMALLIRHCSGIVCLCLTDERIRRLRLPMMTEVNTNSQGTAFTVSIEAAEGVTTGVSAADRVATVQATSARRPGRKICAAPAMSFRCGRVPAAFWSVAAIPKPRWTSWPWPVLSPAGYFAN